MPSVLYRASQLTKSFVYAADWSFNPTHTDSALIAVESFVNQKTRFPKLEESLRVNPGASSFLDDPEFAKDMESDWVLSDFKNKYDIGSLGYEYAVFMQKLGYKQLQFNLANHISPKIQNYIKMGLKNHDLIHLLFGL